MYCALTLRPLASGSSAYPAVPDFIIDRPEGYFHSVLKVTGSIEWLLPSTVSALDCIVAVDAMIYLAV